MSKKMMHTRELVAEVARRTRYRHGQTRRSVVGLYPQGRGIAHLTYFGYDYSRIECPAMNSIQAMDGPTRGTR